MNKKSTKELLSLTGTDPKSIILGKISFILGIEGYAYMGTTKLPVYEFILITSYWYL